jgi:hypothetical protein
MYTPPLTLKWFMASGSGFNSRNAFVYIRGSYSSKNIAKSRWSVHLRLGRHPQGPKKQAFSTVFAPQQLHERDATEPHIWPNVCLADAPLRETLKIVRAQTEQMVAWPKHAVALCSHGTFHPAGSCAAIPLLEITGPSRKGVAHDVRDSTGVTYGHQGKFAHDTLNGNDVWDRFLVVKLA